jgi:methyltransferase (TIGR00027 family)
MDTGAPSATALGAARLRAVHQILEYPRVLHDPYAIRILGPGAETELRAELAKYQESRTRGLRAGMVLRSRYSDDRFHAALARGVRQYVVLGAGLDTFAWRNFYPEHLLRIFEIDHPATQAWKRARLAEMGMAVPQALTFAPVDFERESLSDGLARAGFRADQPAFFSWLGVAIYLSEEAIMQTLRTITAGVPESEVVFDFTLPSSNLSKWARRRRAESAAAVARLGEPWVTFFTPEAIAARLREAGFSAITVLGPKDANRLYFAARSDGFEVRGSHQAAAIV